jgi:hypothetical protein
MHYQDEISLPTTLTMLAEPTAIAGRGRSFDKPE